MRTIGAVAGVVALAGLVWASSPAAAFGVHIGPFYFGVPFLGHRHHHYHHAIRAEPRSDGLHDEATSGVGTSAREPSSRPNPGLDSPLLYPALALPTIYDNIFRPSAVASWPISYDAVFRTAFAKPHTGQSANACPQAGRADVVGERIRREIGTRGVQLQLLQRLNGALAMAAKYLVKACPTDVPADPVARLQLVQWQIEKLAEALDIVRPPLQAFEQSLNASQRARFAAVTASASGDAPRDRAAAAQSCVADPSAVDRSIEHLSQSARPTDAQRGAVTALRQSFHDAANELDANCRLAASPGPLARLEAIQSRLDAAWRAVLTIQVALDDFDKQLSDEQRARLEATDFATAQ